MKHRTTTQHLTNTAQQISTFTINADSITLSSRKPTPSSHPPIRASSCTLIVSLWGLMRAKSSGSNYYPRWRAFNTASRLSSSVLLIGINSNTSVIAIDYSSPNSITINNHDDSCIVADYAIITSSLGVLKNDVVAFTPPFPDWKIAAIEGMQMGTYTKIFLQFPASADGSYFWEKTNPTTQFFLYADPISRGYYPVWQSLNGPGFLPSSGIFFVIVVASHSCIVEN